MDVAQREYKNHTCILFLGSEHDSYTVPCAFRWPKCLRYHSKIMHPFTSSSPRDRHFQPRTSIIDFNPANYDYIVYSRSRGKLDVIETSISAVVVAFGRLVQSCSLVRMLSFRASILSETVKWYYSLSSMCSDPTKDRVIYEKHKPSKLCSYKMPARQHTSKALYKYPSISFLPCILTETHSSDSRS